MKKGEILAAAFFREVRLLWIPNKQVSEFINSQFQDL